MAPQISYNPIHLFMHSSQRSVAKYIQVSQGRNLMVTLTPPLLVPKIKPIFKQGFSVLSPIHLSCLLPSPKPWLTPMLSSPWPLHWLPNSYSPPLICFSCCKPIWFSQRQISNHHLFTLAYCCIWFSIIPPWPGGFCSSFQPHLFLLSQQCALQPFLTFSSSNLAHTLLPLGLCTCCYFSLRHSSHPLFHTKSHLTFRYQPWCTSFLCLHI